MSVASVDLSESMARSLQNRFSQMAEDANPEELENLKLLLCMAAGGLAPRGETPMSAGKKAAFRSVITSLNKLGIGGETWVGRLKVLTDEKLIQLQKEAKEVRLSAKATDRYFLGCGGPIVNEFSSDPRLVEEVQKHFPNVKPTGIASYIYYEGKGQGLDPHVDTETYAVNVIIMLNHKFEGEKSALLLYEDIVPYRVELEIGHAAIINAGAIVHGREDMGKNEEVSIITIGFN